MNKRQEAWKDLSGKPAPAFPLSGPATKSRKTGLRRIKVFEIDSDAVPDSLPPSPRNPPPSYLSVQEMQGSIDRTFTGTSAI